MIGKYKQLLLAVLLLLSLGIKAQEVDSGFGGWHFLEISHRFSDSSNWTGMLYFEHENYQYQRLDCWYLRPGVRYAVLPWLKLGLSYDYLKLPDTYGHRAVFDAVGTLKDGNLSTSLRLRYLHTWKPEHGTQDNELRTRLIVLYKVPDTKLRPYMAVEIFMWRNQWCRSRHYVACTYDVTKYMQLEGFYMITFSNKDPQHILGFGMNFNI